MGEGADAAAGFGALLARAIAEKAASREGGYTYRDLERDSGVNFSYAQKVVQGGRRPSQAVVEAWARALAPHLPLEEALILAGYVPPERRDLYLAIARLPAEAVAEVEAAVRRLATRHPPPARSPDG